MTVLETLIEKNTYPIIFIGSGMSLRYLENFPNWDDLIKNLWKKAFDDFDDNNYYMYMNQLRTDLEKKHKDKTSGFVSYLLNIAASSEIEKKFNEQYVKGEIKVDGFSNQELFKTGISPFKKEIANIFSSLKIKEEMEQEFQIYKKFLSKAKIILTTNYDEVIENAYNSIVLDNPIDTYVGQEGFLRENIGYAELYKIHGSSSKPKSIIITEEDYRQFDKKSVLISAKIIAGLINSPVIFLGYSLTDENIRSIIRDFSGSLNLEDSISASERIIVVEREEGKQDIAEAKVMEKDLGIELTSIKTDNFGLLFESLNEINEGVSSAFINQYSKLFKQMIIERGREGTLETLLVSPTELRDLENNKQLRKNAAVVMADAALVYLYPHVIDYFINYFEGEKLNADVGLHFIANQLPRTNIPFWWYVNNLDSKKSSLNSHEKDKLKARMDRFNKAETVIKKLPKYYDITFNSIEELEKCEYAENKKINIVAFNIDRFPKEVTRNFILEELKTLKANDKYQIDTSLRMLCVLYDIKYVKKSTTEFEPS